MCECLVFFFYYLYYIFFIFFLLEFYVTPRVNEQVITYILLYINVFPSERLTIKSGFDNDLDVTSVLLSRIYGKWRLSLFFFFFYCCFKQSMLISSARKFPKKKTNLNTPLYPRWNVIVNGNDPKPRPQRRRTKHETGRFMYSQPKTIFTE